jgi:hypothetical protein
MAAMIADYVAKLRQGPAEIEAWMKAETWFDAQEAVDAGFCNSVVPTTAAGANGQGQAFNLSAYENAPKALTEPKPSMTACASACCRPPRPLRANGRLVDRSTGAGPPDALQPRFGGVFPMENRINAEHQGAPGPARRKAKEARNLLDTNTGEVVEGRREAGRRDL